MIDLLTSIPSWLIPAILSALSVLALGIALERTYFFWRGLGAVSSEEEARLLELIRSGQYEEASRLCAEKTHPVFQIARLLLKSEPGRLRAIRQLELPRLLRRLHFGLPLLGTISTIAPLLGLLGTVTGMMKSFHAFGVGAQKSLELTGGIDEALITTALGLCVAIPSLVLYNYFANKANEIGEETENLSVFVAQELSK